MITQIDIQIMMWIQEHMRSEFMDSFMKFITWIGDWMLLWAILFVIYFIFKKQGRNAKILALSLCISFLVNQLVLKNIVKRPRPFVENSQLPSLINEPTSYSFPSSHSATSFAVASSLSLVNKSLRFISYLLAILIAFSRVYLNVHHPSDVLVGALVGILSTYVAEKIVNLFEKRKLAK
ncbi:phosphatase PAP2 family protein [Anaerorhabdus sp.]|uniref:phosphatase PAP2 family protein n=1 Tax=Anaerorhabdus sp. TaxID=1872524 RepID=UPI002FC870E9